MSRYLVIFAAFLALASCRTTGSATLADLQAKQSETDTHLGNVDAGLSGLEATTTGDTRAAVVAVREELKKVSDSHGEEVKLAAEASVKVAATETSLEKKTVEVKEVKKERNTLAAIIAAAALIAALVVGMKLARRFGWKIPIPFP